MVVRLGPPVGRIISPDISTLNSLGPRTPALGDSGGTGARIQPWPSQVGRLYGVSRPDPVASNARLL